jgi:Fic family protein
VTVERDRLRPLIIGNTRPRDRSEEEIVGYRLALNWIHTDYLKIPVTPETCLRLHALAQGGTSGDAGKWKTSSNDIVEIFPDGRREVRFRPLAPDLVSKAMDELCLSYRQAMDQLQVTPLLASACFVLDFLCIHPFRDGNGRISRLLT